MMPLSNTTSVNLPDLFSRIGVFEFTSYRAVFKRLYDAAKVFNSDYTYANFSKDLGFSAGSTLIHLIVSGRRNLTLIRAQKCVQKLQMPALERSYFLTLVEFENTKDNGRRDMLQRRLLDIRSKSLSEQSSQGRLEFLSSWLHPTIFETLELFPEGATAEDIADRLLFRASVSEIRQSFALLKKLGLVEIVDHSGKAAYRKVGRNFSTGEEVKGVGIIQYHTKMLELARESLKVCPAELREITSTTLTVSHDEIRELKGLIREFKRYLMLRSANPVVPERVVQVNFQIFPLTK